MLGRDDLVPSAYLNKSTVPSDIDTSIWRNREPLRVRGPPVTHPLGRGALVPSAPAWSPRQVASKSSSVVVPSAPACKVAHFPPLYTGLVLTTQEISQAGSVGHRGSEGSEEGDVRSPRAVRSPDASRFPGHNPRRGLSLLPRPPACSQPPGSLCVRASVGCKQDGDQRSRLGDSWGRPSQGWQDVRRCPRPQKHDGIRVNRLNLFAGVSWPGTFHF